MGFKLARELFEAVGQVLEPVPFEFPAAFVLEPALGDFVLLEGFAPFEAHELFDIVRGLLGLEVLLPSDKLQAA